MSQQFQANGTLVYRVRGAVDDSAFRPQRRPATPHCVQNSLRANDIEIRVLLPGKASCGQILCRRRGANGDGSTAAKALICVEYGGDYLRGDRSCKENASLIWPARCFNFSVSAESNCEKSVEMAFATCA